MQAHWWHGKKGEWYVVIQFILFGLIFFAPFLTRSWQSWPPPWDMVGVAAGGVLALLGLGLSLAGVSSLGRNLTAVPHPKDDAVLVESGAYRIVRHPIYSGIIFGSFGWALLTNSLAAIFLSLILLLFFDVKSRREERWLCTSFPDYPNYQARVRKLVPFLY